MKVNLYGFTLTPGAGITLADFQDYLEQQSSSPKLWQGKQRIFVTRKLNDYAEGLFITIKDQKRYCELRKVADSFEVKVRDLEAGTQLMDFNYFVWNTTTGRGLYQHYWQSCAHNRFGLFLHQAYAALKHQTAVKMLGAEPATTQQRKVGQALKGSLEFALMTTKADLDLLLSELEKVNQFQVDIESFADKKGSDWEPLSKFISKERVSVSFDPRFKTSPKLKTTIQTLIKKLSPKSGQIKGVDSQGVERVIDILENYDGFGQFDFDEIAKAMTFSLDKWHGATMLQKIHEVIGKQSKLFERPTK
jgi:hypothetical protein